MHVPSRAHGPICGLLHLGEHFPALPRQRIDVFDLFHLLQGSLKHYRFVRLLIIKDLLHLICFCHPPRVGTLPKPPVFYHLQQFVVFSNCGNPMLKVILLPFPLTSPSQSSLHVLFPHLVIQFHIPPGSKLLPVGFLKHLKVDL